MTQSYAVWYEPSDPASGSSCSVDVHFNLWKTTLASHQRKIGSKAKQSKHVKYLLDVGVLVNEIRSVKSLSFYCPYKLEKDLIFDLGTILVQSPQLVNAIFNESWDSRKEAEFPDELLMTDSEGFDKVKVHSLDMARSCSVVPIAEGSEIKIGMNENSAQEVKSYYRFRIRIPKEEFVSKAYRPMDGFLQTALTASDVVDFRLNERRNLPHSLFRPPGERILATLMKVHFLMMRPLTEDLIPVSAPVSQSRQIEWGMWRDYLEGRYSDTEMVAYHWKYKDKDLNAIESINLLAKFRFRHVNIKTIMLYLIIAAILGIGFSLVASQFDRALHPTDESESIIDHQEDLSRENAAGE